MRRAAILCVGLAGLPMAVSAQNKLEIRHNSRVEVVYEYPYTMLEDTIAGLTAYEPFSLSHSVSYDDEFLDFDPTATSSFSVDSVEFVEQTAPNQALYDVTISGELFRSGVGPATPGQFNSAQPELVVNIMGFPDFGPSGLTIVVSYSLTASFESDVDLSTYASRPLLTIQKFWSDGTTEDIHTFEATGSSGSETFTDSDDLLSDALQIVVIADPYEILVAHEGHTTVTFEGTFRLLTGLAPEPCLADVNGDGDVTPADFSAWVAAFNSGAPECDQNGDELCTPADFSAWVANFNAGCD